MKPSMLFILLLTPNFSWAQQAPRCETVFAQLPTSSVLTKMQQRQSQIQQDPAFAFFLSLTPAQQIHEASQRLEQRGVLFRQERERAHWFDIFGTPRLVIEPSLEAAELNRLAYHLQKNMQVQLVYNPTELRNGTQAYYQPTKKELGLPQEVAFSGDKVITLFHEIRHAAMSHAVDKGQPHLFEGHVLLLRSNQSPSNPYEAYLSFQEIAAFFQDANYHFKAALKTLPFEADKALRLRRAQHVQQEIRTAKSVLELANAKLQEAQRILRNNQGQIHLGKEKSNSKTLYFVSEVYEWQFVIKKQSPHNQDLREILRDHLSEMQQQTAQRLERLAQMTAELTKLSQ